MLAESVAASGNETAQMVQASLPAANENAQNGGADIRTEKQTDFSNIAEIIAEVQTSLDIIGNLDLQFSIHEGTGKIMVTVRDEASGEVVREIPAREILDLAAKLDAMVGLIFDQNC